MLEVTCLSLNATILLLRVVGVISIPARRKRLTANSIAIRIVLRFKINEQRQRLSS
jgi:hypothetical protein